MTYQYISQKLKDFDFYIREARILPSDLDPFIRQSILLAEEGYRRGDLDRRRATIWGTVFKEKFGYKYRIISDKHIVIIPKSNTEFMKNFLSYPQLTAILGNRYAGKTITSWTITLKTLEQKEDTFMYVYGDVDGIAEQVMNMRPDLSDRIIVKENYQLPPKDDKEKIVLYNELSKEIMGKRAMAEPNLEAALQAFRNRHLKAWVVYNVIRYKSLESELRETADIKNIKWLSPELLESTAKLLPKAYGELLKLSITLNQNENLVIAPVLGKGVLIFLHDTNPPKWLLEAHKRAEENKWMMMGKNERQRYIIERIGQLKEKGLSTTEIQYILDNEGITLSKRSIQLKAKKWRQLVGLEENKNNKKA